MLHSATRMGSTSKHSQIHRQIGILFGTAMTSLMLAGCPSILPETPPQAGGPEETPYSFKHHTQVIWDFPELNQLKSLQILHPAHVSLLQSNDSDELSVQLEFEIEKPHHDIYADEYLKQISAQSVLQGENQKLAVPAPLHPCKEIGDSSGNLIELEGICVREMSIILPSGLPSGRTSGLPSPASNLTSLSIEAGGGFSTSRVSLPLLALLLDDGSYSEINRFTGNLKILGGGSKASLQIDGLLDAGQKTSGDLDLELSTIQHVTLRNISGKVHIAVTHPSSDPNAVQLDDKSITTFPFDRP
jgi:hypothetical protein